MQPIKLRHRKIHHHVRDYPRPPPTAVAVL